MLDSYISIPVKDEYGILMRKDSPLAGKDVIRPEDLHDKPIIFNRNTRDGDLLTSWLGKSLSDLNVAELIICCLTPP